MKLNRDIYGDDAGPPLLIAHGLYGSARNWSTLAKRLGARRRVIIVDMRNHGDSPWSAEAGYAAMAGDLAETIDDCGGEADVLGHSMGGKAAMALALTRPALVCRLIVADIAPVAYDHAHGDYIAAMRGVDLAAVSRRSQADPMLAPAIPQAPLRAFLLQNLVVGDGPTRWRMNLDGLAAAIDDLLAFPDFGDAQFDGPALFLRGGASDYVGPRAEPAIAALFPQARIATVEGAGHWLHAERPEAFLAAVEAFLSEG